MKKFLLILLSLLSTQVFAQNYRTTLAGKRLVMDGATCAGIEFNKTATLVNMRAEMVCQMNDKDIENWRVTWVNNEVFFLTETVRPNEISPPRNFVFQITSINGKKVVVKDYWTGWGKSQTDIISYTIRNP